MRLFVTLMAYFAALVLIATLAFGTLMAAANSPQAPWLAEHGVDGGLLMLVGWAVVLVLPVWVARAVWRRLGAGAIRRDGPA